MFRKVITLIVLTLVLLTISVAGSDSSVVKANAPKLIAKTTYDVKWVKGPNGKLIEQKIPKKQLFQKIMKKTSMPDPTDPSKSITVDVPTEVPYVPNKKASSKVAQLKARYQALKKRENQLKAEFDQTRHKLVDHPVVEDGAPAPPDAQMQKMAQDLYDELEATQFHKAKNIRQEDIQRAREFAKGMGANRQQIWDRFDEMRKKMLVPSHGWGMTM